MPEINLDDADRQEVFYLQTLHRQQALIKANRFLLMLVLALMAAVFILGLVLLPRQNLLAEIQKNQTLSMAYATQNPALSAEITTLKGQLFGLLSGSIDSKLKSLEETIKKGSVSASLETIQALKGDVKILATYSGDTATKAETSPPINQTLIKELDTIKDLVYLTFVSCGLMIAAIAGVWLRGRRRLSHQFQQQAFLDRQG